MSGFSCFKLSELQATFHGGVNTDSTSNAILVVLIIIVIIAIVAGGVFYYKKIQQLGPSHEAPATQKSEM